MFIQQNIIINFFKEETRAKTTRNHSCQQGILEWNDWFCCIDKIVLGLLLGSFSRARRSCLQTATGLRTFPKCLLMTTLAIFFHNILIRKGLIFKN